MKENGRGEPSGLLRSKFPLLGDSKLDTMAHFLLYREGKDKQAIVLIGRNMGCAYPVRRGTITVKPDKHCQRKFQCSNETLVKVYALESETFA